LFRAGDRVAFLGDSITAGGGCHRILADYYPMRFPDADIRFTNAGRGGDSTHGAALRFADDVAASAVEWDDQERLLAGCDAAWPGVRALAKPVPHRYELSRKEN
jgi:hypothetical protein